MQLLVGSLLHYLPLIEYQDAVSMFNEIQRMRDQQYCFLFEVFFDSLIEQKGANVSINRTQNIIQNEDISVAIEGPCQRNSSLLTS